MMAGLSAAIHFKAKIYGGETWRDFLGKGKLHWEFEEFPNLFL